MIRLIVENWQKNAPAATRREAESHSTGSGGSMGGGGDGAIAPPPEGLGKFFLLLLMQIHSVLHFETRRLTNVESVLIFFTYCLVNN
jgi:hypothetical protein